MSGLQSSPPGSKPSLSVAVSIVLCVALALFIVGVAVVSKLLEWPFWIRREINQRRPQQETLEHGLGSKAVESIPIRKYRVIGKDDVAMPSASKSGDVNLRRWGFWSRHFPGSQSQAEQPPKTCSICTEDFLEGVDIRALPCGHIFHPPCIDPWLMDLAVTCPLWYVAWPYDQLSSPFYSR